MSEDGRWESAWAEVVHEELVGADVVTFRVQVLDRERGVRWGQAVMVEESRLDRYPSLYGQTLDRIVREIEAKVTPA